jgi:hypothetical protein
MRSVLALAAVLLSACGGGGGGDDDVATPDAMLPCGDELCAALGSPCGMAVDSCGTEIDCGTCSYDEEPIGLAGTRPAIDVTDVVNVAYVETQPSYGVVLATRGEQDWSYEPIETLDGPPLGPLDLRVTGDGTRWLTFIDDGGQLRVATAPKGGAWLVSGSLGAGVAAALAIDADSQPVIAVAGVIEATTGIFVLTPDGAGGWTSTPVGDPTAAGAPGGLGFYLRGRDVSLAWRDPGDDVVRYATGKGSAFTIEIVDPSAPAPRAPGAMSLSVDPSGRAHVIYGRAGQAVHAVRSGELWQPEPLPFEAGDGDDALAIGLDGTVHGALFDAGGLRVLDGIAGYILSQTVSSRCSDGEVDIAAGVDGSVHLVEACQDGLLYLTRAGPQ